MTSSIEINGRSVHSDRAEATVTVRNDIGEQLFTIHGGSVDQLGQNGRFVLTAKHPTATDVEHDSSYVAHFEGGGLRLVSMLGRSVILEGTLFSARYYSGGVAPEGETSGDCAYCHEEHPILPFTPPTQKFEAGIYELRVRFETDDD